MKYLFKYNMFGCLLFLLLLMAGNQTAFAQKAAVQGKVVDNATKAPVEYATVALVNAVDTSLIAYTLTDKKGAFSLSSLPAERECKLIISCVGYTPVRTILNFKKGELKDFGIIPIAGLLLNEVVIEGERSPVIVKKDTIEFNAEAFKTRPNAVVEELLRKLPGVQVNMDGSIMVNGKAISRLLVNDKRFFGDDYKMATKNLDADLIAKIQVYDDRETDPNHTIPETDLKKIINLKLKGQVRKSTIGKFFVGGGTRGRFEAGGLLSTFRDTLQISVIGVANNLNSTGFSGSDLYTMGGYNRLDQNTITSYRGKAGIDKVGTIGVNINNDYGKELKLNLMYAYDRSELTNNNTSFSEQDLETTRLSTYAAANSTQVSNSHKLSGNILWQSKSGGSLRYIPFLSMATVANDNLSTANSFNSQRPRLSDYTYSSNARNRNNRFSHEFHYNKPNKKGRLYINQALTLNKNNTDTYSDNSVVSYTSDLNTEVLNRFADQNKVDRYGHLTVSYTRIFTNKLSVDFRAGSVFSRVKHALSTFDKNMQSGGYDLLLVDQSNEQARTVWVHAFRPMAMYRLSDNSSLMAELNGQYQQGDNRFGGAVADIHKHYFNVLPIVSFYSRNFSVSYREDFQQPEIAQMQPVVRELSQLYRTVGNPDLKPEKTHTLNAGFYNYIAAKQINMNANANVSLTDNGVIQTNRIDETGATMISYVNRSGNLSAGSNLAFDKQFKKQQDFQASLNTQLSFNLNRTAIILNADEGIQNRYIFNAVQGFTVNYKELLTLGTEYRLSRTVTRYRKVDYKTIDNYTHIAGVKGSLRWPKNVIVDASYNYNYNPQVPQGFKKSANILNLSVAMMMQKNNRGQLKLSVYDLFDQNVAINRIATVNSVVTSDQLILKRYGLLTYQYKLNNVKK